MTRQWTDTTADGLRYTAAYATPVNARYLRQDFQIMMKKVTLLQLLIDNGVPMISELFDEYKDAMVAHIAQVQEVSLKSSSQACPRAEYVPAC